MSDDLTLTAKPQAAVGRSPRASGRGGVPALLILVALALGWEGVKALFGISDQKLPHLLAIFSEFGTRTRGGAGPVLAVAMFENAVVTFGEALFGFALGGLLGCTLAVVFASSRLLERGLLPFVVGSQTVPILAIAPMVVVALGRIGAPDLLVKAVVAAYLTFFPVTIGMLRGLRSVPPDALALMRSYAASGGQTFWKLRLPAALPYLFNALKICSTLSMIGAVVAEFFGGTQNALGVYIKSQAGILRLREAWSGILMACLLGIGFYLIIVALERWLMPWHVSFRKDRAA